ncbi:MAG TPA: PAS domain S-box protein [Candidatus Angelobacter sp.]|nr:PAS domain S-box protein [Candidatus Angelobacter sp.]
MSPLLEQIVIFSVMSVLVTLFTWIYIRNRQQRVGLWMLGWIAIFIHFAAIMMASFSLLSASWTSFIRVGTLEVAGTSFVLSVSEAYGTTRRRILYFLLFGLPSIVYLGLLIWSPQHRWMFPTLVIGSTFALLANSWRYYRAKNASFYFFLAIPGAYAVWSGIKSVSTPLSGLLYFLSIFFIIAGLLYVQYYKRITPGVLVTSISFVLWGLVFPVGTALSARQMGPSQSSVFWDLPKYMVAFGMILTLFENETAAATSAARQYRSLFEGNLAAVYVSTLQGVLLDCNAAFVNMYGYSSKEEMLANPTPSLYGEPGDRERFLEHLRQEGQVINYECRQRKKDGSAFWILERATIFADASGRQIIEGTAIDITERKHTELALKESEERFATLFRHSPIGCGIVSLDGVFLNGNEALEKVLGRPIGEITGKTGVELGLWESQEDRDQFYRRLRAEGSIKNMEIHFTDTAGNKHIGIYYGTLVRIADQECIFGMQLDCTEQRELEAKFLQAQKMEAVGRLAGGVAHDFNNLLGVIGGYAELLEAEVQHQEKLHSYCRKIMETARRAGSLTSQLLTFSRKEISQPAPLKPNRAIRESVSILSRLIGEDIEINLELDATGTILIDKVHFEQIIFNIVVNARDAMPQGGQLTITTEDKLHVPLSSASGDGAAARYVSIEIRDNGIGMDEGTRLRAFEPFFTTKETGRGTGLGLAMVYGIVQQCGGEINIESQPGEGTQITICLPVTDEMETVEEQKTSRRPMRGSGHLLLVEDEDELRNTNAEYLSAIGYSVTCAGSGPEALELLDRAEPIDLVISDVVMPKMSGREFVNRLLKVRPETKLLFVSGYADDVVLKTGIPRLGTPFLQKPYSLRELAAKIHQILTADVPETADDHTLANGD